MVLGAIVGDIVGSRFERSNYRSKDFALFTAENRATDDSMMTLAVAKALLKKFEYIKQEEATFDSHLLSKLTVEAMQEIGRKYPNRGYGGMFSRWLRSDDPKPYNSFGNGAAMRISPIAYATDSEEELIRYSEAVTSVTHNHPEGLKGAEATALAIFLARQKVSKTEIKRIISAQYYPLDFSLAEIRKTYRFDPTCQGTVPQAIVAFLEATSFEDALRNAISLGGDSDTLAAITGSIAEAYYGVPPAIKQHALTYLDADLIAIYQQWVTIFEEKAK